MAVNVAGPDVVGARVVVFVEVDGSLLSVAGVVVGVEGMVLSVCCDGDVPTCSRPGAGVAVVGTDGGTAADGVVLFGGPVLGVVVGEVCNGVVCVVQVASRR